VRTRLAIVAIALLSAAPVLSAQRPAATSDLDDFMARVLAKRDDNWKKLQQYILDERQEFFVTGPAGVRLFGGVREYQWFPREGFFVRSPVRADGVAIGEPERRKEEERYLERQKQRDKRKAERNKDGDAAADAPLEVGDILRQSSEPEFVSSAYFMKFKFDQGQYALVGREKVLGRDVLKIEYYPTNLFNDIDDDDDDRRGKRDKDAKPNPKEDKIDRQMNKTARVTLWVEPNAHQILQYEFHNVQLDFLPGRSLVRIDGMHAAMRMGQPFPDVWLPESLGFNFKATIAAGSFDVRYDVKQSDYRLAATSARIR
jgi:hypothetical protein